MWVLYIHNHSAIHSQNSSCEIHKCANFELKQFYGTQFNKENAFRFEENTFVFILS